MPLVGGKKRRGGKRPKSRRTRKSRASTKSKAVQTLVYKRYRAPASPFPPQLYTTLSFSQNFTLTQVTTDVVQNYTFRCNSIFDPDFTGGGLQPRYFDTLLGANNTDTPYHQYRVHACSVLATFWPTANGVQQSGFASVGMRKSQSSAPTSLKEMRERPFYRTRPIYPTATDKPVTIKNFIKIKKILGNKDLVDNEETLADYNSNPVQEIYGDISICNVGTSTTQQFVDVRITYFCQLITLNDVADS